MFDTKMAEFQAELSQANRKNPNSIAALNTEFLSFKAFVCSGLSLLREEVNSLARGVNRLEMRTRCKMLLVHGIPEQDKEDCSARVTESLSAKIKVPNFTADSIRTAYRMGKTKGSKPRPIVLKFTDQIVRDKVWNGKVALKGTKVTLSEFLTPSLHSVFMSARDLFGVNNCWTRDGRIIIKAHDGTKHKVESMAELQAVPTPDEN